MVPSKTGKLSCEQAVRTSDIAHISSTVSITTIGVEELIRTFRRSSGLWGGGESGFWIGLSNEFILICPGLTCSRRILASAPTGISSWRKPGQTKVIKPHGESFFGAEARP